MLENIFFRDIDQRASNILEKIEEQGIEALNIEDRQCWVVFLIALRQRNAERMAHFANRADEAFQRDWKEYRAKFYEQELDRGKSFEEFLEELEKDRWFERTNKLLVQNAISLPNTTDALLEFVWEVIEFGPPNHFLLTSDRPLIMTNGIQGMEGHVALPIGPRKLFVAARNITILRKIKNTPRLPDVINNLLTRAANKEVYAHNREQTKFIDRRLGRRKIY